MSLSGLLRAAVNGQQASGSPWLNWARAISQAIENLPAGPMGPQGPPGTAPPREVSASALSISVGNSATSNSSALGAWSNNPALLGTVLAFDQIGTYNFDRQIQLPVYRTLRGASPGVILRYTGTPRTGGPGASFVTSLNGPVLELRDLTINANSLCDYGVEFASYGPSAGPTAYLRRVSVQYGTVSCIFGRNTYFDLENTQTVGGPIGYTFEGCSESSGIRVSAVLHTDRAIKLLGSHAGTGAPNGNRWNLYSVVLGVPGAVGIDVDGVAQLGVYGFTCEGASDTSILVQHNSSNVRMYGVRSNAGLLARIDGCNNVQIEGGCVSTQQVEYLNNARKCRARLLAESFIAPQDILQKFGVLQWRCWIRPDGTILAVDNVPPTDGFWEAGDKVYRSLPAIGLPEGWICLAGGNPGTWGALANVVSLAA